MRIRRILACALLAALAARPAEAFPAPPQEEIIPLPAPATPAAPGENVIAPGAVGPGRLLALKPFNLFLNGWMDRPALADGLPVADIPAKGPPRHGETVCQPAVGCRQVPLPPRPEGTVRFAISPLDLPSFAGFAAGGGFECGWTAAAQPLCQAFDPREAPYAALRGDAGKLQTIDLPAPVADIALAEDHGCILTQAGTVHCFGSLSSGQSGLAVRSQGWLSPARAARIPLPNPASAIAVADEGSCALVDGRAWCWGRIGIGNGWPGMINDRMGAVLIDAGGYFGRPDGARSLLSGGVFKPQRIGNIDALTALSMGKNGVCALRAGGTVHCMPALQDRPEDGGDFDRLGSVPIDGVSGATALAVGDDFLCVIDAGGRLACPVDAALTTGRQRDGRSLPSGVEVSEIKVFGGTLCIRFQTGALACGGIVLPDASGRPIVDWGFVTSKNNYSRDGNLWLLTGGSP